MGTNELNRDLNIFWDSEDDGSTNASADIFGAGDVTDSETSDDGTDMFGPENESASEDATATEETDANADVGESETQETDSTATEAAEWEDTSSTESTDETSTEADPLDAEMETLFKQLETEASSDNPEQNVMDDIINELRMTAAQRDTEISFLKKQVETLQNRVLESASRETDQAINQPLISKVEADPRLRAIVHLSWNQDEAARQKQAKILWDMYSELTGIDVASLAEESQNSKMTAALGAGKGSSWSIDVQNRESIPVSYEQSTSDLW